MARARMELLGARELERTFKTLGDRVQRKVLRKAVNAAGTPVVKAARSKAPSESNTLKKSMGKKIKTYKATGTVAAIIGPRTDVQGEHNGQVRIPKFYAHLVEGGHIDANGNHVPGQPFLRPAFDETQGQALGVMKEKLADGVAKEAKKAAGGR
jgi:HK97 gp10 family phage protein